MISPYSPLEWQLNGIISLLFRSARTPGAATVVGIATMRECNSPGDMQAIPGQLWSHPIQPGASRSTPSHFHLRESQLRSRRLVSRPAYVSDFVWRANQI